MLQRSSLFTSSGLHMGTSRHWANDPRTVARDIPGIVDAIFPQLASGVVTHLNRTAFSVLDCAPVPDAFVVKSSLQRAMLFELAVAVGEELIFSQTEIDWDACLAVAVQ